VTEAKTGTSAYPAIADSYELNSTMDCRPGCGACCTAPSISSPIPGMPHGNRAGEPCAHLTPNLACDLFDSPERPVVCGSLQPSAEMCGASREHALFWLERLEQLTRPQA